MEHGERSIVLAVGTSAKSIRVRDTLRQISGRMEWVNDNLWHDYLKARRDIFGNIYADLPKKDWNDPQAIQVIDRKYIQLAKAKGEKELEWTWTLQGGWLDSRADIVAWLRINYVKGNKKRLELDIGGETGEVAAAAKELGEAGPDPEDGARQVDPTRSSWLNTVMGGVSSPQ